MFRPAFLGLLALGISCVKATCETNCIGCCDAQGVCREGLSGVQCGTAGQACRECTANESCLSGLCHNPNQDVPAPRCEFAGDLDAGLGEADVSGLADYCAQRAVAVCERFARCGELGDKVACLAARPEALATCFDESAAFKDGRMAFDPTAGQACLDFISNQQGCGRNASPGPDCAAVFAGLVADGQPCYVDLECGPMSRCKAHLDGACPGLCVPRATEPLELVALCVDPLYSYEGACLALVPFQGNCGPLTPGGKQRRCVDGAACDRLSAVCLGPGECRSNENCELGFRCQENACVRLTEPILTTTCPCPIGYFCQIETGFIQTMHCVRLGGAGRCNLTAQGGQVCQQGLTCQWKAPDPQSWCRPALGPCAPCLLSFNNGGIPPTMCESRLRCQSFPGGAQCWPTRCQDPSP